MESGKSSGSTGIDPFCCLVFSKKGREILRLFKHKPFRRG